MLTFSTFAKSLKGLPASEKYNENTRIRDIATSPVLERNRISELVGFDIDDINISNEFAVIRRRKRVLVFAPEVREALLEYLLLQKEWLQRKDMKRPIPVFADEANHGSRR